MKGVRSIPAGAEIRGIPVVYVASSPYVAHAAGIWPLKRIIVGPRWFDFDAEEQAAVLMHEVYHCRALHMEIRWLMLPFFWTEWARRIGREQEFSADRFAAREGYRHELMYFLSRYPPREEPFHPSSWERIRHLAKGAS